MIIILLWNETTPRPCFRVPLRPPCAERSVWRRLSCWWAPGRRGRRPWSGDRLLPVEVKTGAKPVPRDARNLEVFLDEYPDLAPGGLLLHGGHETFPLTRRVLATPWYSVL